MRMQFNVPIQFSIAKGGQKTVCSFISSFSHGPFRSSRHSFLFIHLKKRKQGNFSAGWRHWTMRIQLNVLID